MAHAMICHGAYFDQYQRRDDDEKEELYEEVEPAVLIFDQTKNKEKIRKLKEANEKVDQIQQQLEDEKQARLASEKQNKQALAKLREEILKNQ